MSPELRAKIDAIEAKFGGQVGPPPEPGDPESRESKAQLERIMRVLRRKPKPAKPRVVVEEGRVVAEAEVEVSPRDPNWREGLRPGFVTINQEWLEREWRAARAQEEWDRRRRAEIDPVGLGHWGPRR